MRRVLAPLTLSGDGLEEGTAAAIRLSIIVLAVIAVVLTGQPIDQRLVYLGVGYLLTTSVLWWASAHIEKRWLVYAGIFVDVGAITALLAFAPATPLPLWVLYLLPVIIAGLAGSIPAATSASLAAIGYIALIWLTTETISLANLWPVIVFAATAIAVSGLFAGRLVEQQEKVAWKEVAAIRPLAGADEPDDAAAAVAERARRLAKADRAWLWWCVGDEQLPVGVKTGPPAEGAPVPAPVTRALAEKLAQGPAPLAELDRRWVDLYGEMLALRLDQTKVTVALLAVGWDRSPDDRALLRERLKVFAPWAAEALSQAQARAAMAEASRREHILRQTAEELAETFDRQAVLEKVIEAARGGIRAAVSLVEQPSGHVMAGDSEVAEALTRLAVSSEAIALRTGPGPTPTTGADRVQVAVLEESLALVAWRRHPPLEEADASWLGELAGIARTSLRRCAVYYQLQQQEQRMSASLGAAPAPVAIWDATGELVFANAAYRSLGLQDVPPRDVPAAGIRQEEIILEKPPSTFEVLTTQVADGRYTLSVYHDVTRERDALRAKDELISMVGHELRNPLMSIHGYSQMMGRQLNVVQDQVDRLNRMIGDFIEASKLEGGRLSLKRERISMLDLARAAEERFRGSHPGRTIRTELAEVPAVDGDPVRLGQVLDNLLGNAAKYSRADQEIILTLGVVEGRVLFSVQDFGIGIAPEHLPHLFERFYRVPSEESQRVKGLGLGLSIVRDIVAAHGGYVWAESPGLEKGSTFKVSLPAAAAEVGGRPSKAA